MISVCPMVEETGVSHRRTWAEEEGMEVLVTSSGLDLEWALSVAGHRGDVSQGLGSMSWVGHWDQALWGSLREAHRSGMWPAPRAFACDQEQGPGSSTSQVWEKVHWSPGSSAPAFQMKTSPLGKRMVRRAK